MEVSQKKILLQLLQQCTRDISRSMTAEHRNRLLCPEYDAEPAQIKRFLKGKKTLDVFAICWELEKREAYAAALPAMEDMASGCRIGTEEMVLTQKHSHDYLELAYVIEGELKQIIQGKEVCFQAGELCLIDRNCIHQDEIAGCRGVYLFLGIRDRILEEALEEIREREQMTSHLIQELLDQKKQYQYLHFKPLRSQRDEICELLGKILLYLKEDRIGNRYICRGLVLQLLELLCEKYSVQLLREESGHYRKLLYEEVVLYMESHYENINLQDLVARFQFQEDYFARLIREYSGLGYQEYLQGIRLRKAEEMVRRTDRKIDEIVTACGYHNKGYFYKIFQERYGMTPAQMRRQRQ